MEPLTIVSKLLLKGLDILEQLPQLSSASYVVRFHDLLSRSYKLTICVTLFHSLITK